MKHLRHTLLPLLLACAALGQNIDTLPTILGSAVDKANDKILIRDASVSAGAGALRSMELDELVNVPGMFASLEPALGNPAANGYLLSSTTAGVRSWIVAPVTNLSSGPVTSSSGVSSIADGALSIAKTSGLQTALDAINPATIPGMIAGYQVGQTTRTGALIDVWRDISGNGYDASAVSTKDTVVVDAVNGDYAAGGSVYLPVVAIPATFTNMTVVNVFRSGRRQAGNGFFNNTPFLTDAAASGGGYLASSGSVQFYNPVAVIGCTRNPANQNNVLTARWGGAKRSIRSNGIGNSGTVNATASVTTFAHVWGYTGGGAFGWGQERVAMYLYNRALSDDEVAAIERYHSVPVPTTALHIFGDSFAAGTGASTGPNAYCRLLESSTGKSACIAAGSGATFAAFSSSAVAVAIASSVSAGLNPDVVLDLGKNDLAAGMTAATLQSTYTTFCNAITATGADLVCVSIPPRTLGFTAGATAGSYETERLTFNAWLRTQEGTLFEKLADCGADANLGDVADLAGAYYSGDGVHLSNAGHAAWAAIILAEINALP